MADAGLIWQCRRSGSMWTSDAARWDCELQDDYADHGARWR